MADMATPSGAPRPPDPRASARASDWFSLTKPGITGLIVMVAVAGFLVANPQEVRLLPLAWLVLCGAAASAGAAMLNHYLDQDVDARMRRTSRRPLPAQRVLASGALVGGLVLLGGGVAAAAVVLNLLTAASILLGGLTYVVVYTLWLKRRSSWNIVIGGFAGSAPVLAGSAAATGTWTLGAVALAVLVFLWTPPHFWSLALLLREDYARAGLPMLPKMDDPAYSGRVVVVSAALLIPAAAALAGTVTLPVLVALVGLGVVFVAVASPLWRSVTPRSARRGFLFSGPYLLGVVVALAANVGLVRWGVPVGW